LKKGEGVDEADPIKCHLQQFATILWLLDDPMLTVVFIHKKGAVIPQDVVNKDCV